MATLRWWLLTVVVGAVSVGVVAELCSLATKGTLWP